MVASARQGGFTVIELTVAAAVLSVLAAAIVHAGAGQGRVIRQSLCETQALRIAQSELESMQATSSALFVGSGRFALPEDGGVLPGGYGSRSLREVESGLFEVEVCVCWLPSGASDEREVRLVTRIACDEVAR